MSAVNGALSGSTSYKHSQNAVERMAGVSAATPPANHLADTLFISDRQYIDTKLVVMEHLVSNHPWGITVFIIGILVALFLFLRRVWSQESALADELARKARLD